MSIRDFQVGFTLLELLVTLAILSVTLVLVAPSLRDAVQRNQVRTEVSHLLAAINLARSEAVRRNSAVSLCPSSIAITGEAVCSGVYADGWMVFSNRDRSPQFEQPGDQVIKVFDGLPAGYTITNKDGSKAAAKLITYLADGSAHGNRSLLFCAPGGSARSARSIVMNIIGRARVTQSWGDCPDA